MRCLLVLLFMVIVGIARAQQDTTMLSEVIVRDSRLFVKETAGAKQTPIDSLVLSQNLNHTLSEVLSENTPVFIKSYGRGSMATASFRGTAPSHTQVLWNGMSINSPMLGMVDFSLLPVYFIDGLSLKHGGASTEDIGGALGGSIAISNIPDWRNRFSGRAVQGVGSFTTLEEFAQVNVGTPGIQSKTRAYYTYSKNDFPFVNDAIIGSPSQRNTHAEYSMYSVMQELYGKINSRNIISIQGWLHSADRSLPRLNSYEGADDANINSQFDRTWRLHAAWDHHSEKGTVTTSLGANVQDLDYFLLNYVSGIGSQSAIYSKSQAQSFFSKVQVDHDLSARSSFKFSVSANRHRVNTADSVKKTGYDTDRNEILLYLAYHRSMGDRVNLRASVRQDYIGGNFIPIIPYGGFDFRIFRYQRIFLKGNITRNYHVPTLNDLYWQPGGNPTLKPEQGITQELSVAWEKRHDAFSIESQFTGFYADITDWILWVPNFKGYWEPHNVRRVVAKGLEMTAKIKFTMGNVHFTVNGNYALTRSLNYGDPKTWGDESYGKQLVYIPVHSGNVFVNVRYKTYTVTWQHNSYSRRFTTSSNDLTQRDNLPSYFMNQVYVAKEFRFGRFTFEAQLKTYNLFNEYYRSVLGRRMPGRNYMVLLMIRF